MSSWLLPSKLTFRALFVMRMMENSEFFAKMATADKFIRLWKAALVGDVRLSQMLWWRSLFLRDFAQAQCFSVVLIRHSQSCWLRGWFCCEIMSLIKRSSTHEKACVIKLRSVGGPPSSLKAALPHPPPSFSFTSFPRQEENKEKEQSCLKWPCCSFHKQPRLFDSFKKMKDSYCNIWSCGHRSRTTWEHISEASFECVLWDTLYESMLAGAWNAAQ